MTMKKTIMMVALTMAACGAAGAQVVDEIEVEGVALLPLFYSQKTSHDGSQVAGEAEDGGTIYFNNITKESYYYEDCNYGRGYVISDDGRVVGCQLLDMEGQSTTAVIMKEGEIIIPPVFKGYVTSNIHSITPDGKRICGVVGNNGRGMSYLPFYCDLDENGNLGELQFLPTPELDFYKARPQYCSATWISEDGKTIAGQVVQSRGILIYPIIYHQNDQGIWNYFLPSESLFDQAGVEVPEPLGDFEEEYPGLEVPDPTSYMDKNQKAVWDAAILKWETNNFAEDLDPYSHLPLYMTPEQINKYVEDVEYYNEKFYEYNEKNMAYWEAMFKIADSSVFFVRNGMALSADGKWLASSAQVELPNPDPYAEEVYYHYVPYLFNLETGEYKQLTDQKESLVTNQVFPNGNVLCATPAASALPARSWIYLNEQDKMISIEEYLKDVKKEYYDWLEENLSGDIPVAEDENGELIFEWATVTGQVSASEDFSILYGGVMGYAIGMDMYVTYIFPDLPVMAGVESLESEIRGEETIYNLMGVKVNKDNVRKGIYIINGKKVMVK